MNIGFDGIRLLQQGELKKLKKLYWLAIDDVKLLNHAIISTGKEKMKGLELLERNLMTYFIDDNKESKCTLEEWLAESIGTAQRIIDIDIDDIHWLKVSTEREISKKQGMRLASIENSINFKRLRASLLNIDQFKFTDVNSLLILDLNKLTASSLPLADKIEMLEEAGLPEDSAASMCPGNLSSLDKDKLKEVMVCMETLNTELTDVYARLVNPPKGYTVLENAIDNYKVSSIRTIVLTTKENLNTLLGTCIVYMEG